MISDKIIDNSLLVLDVLRNIGRTDGLEATIFFNESNFDQCTLFYNRKDKYLKVISEGVDQRYFITRTVKLSFMLKETLFTFDSKILNVNASEVILEKPQVIKSSFKRYYSRYSPSQNEEILIKLPTGTMHEVKNITISGVAFYSDEQIYKTGDRIRNLCIIMPHEDIILDADVKYIIETEKNKYFYGVEFTNNNWFSHHSLFSYIFTNTYPDIRQITDFPKEQIYMLYEESNYFNLKPREEIDKTFNDMFNVFNSIKEYPQLISNPAFVHNDKIYIGASALRIYNSTFIAQHLAAIPEARLFPTSKTAVYLSFTDYLICNPYYQYYIAYFDTELEWHKRMFKSIAGLIADEEKYIYDNFEFFICHLNDFKPSLSSSLHSITLDDFTEFSHFAERNLPSLYNRVYNYDLANVNLDEIKQVYEMAGLNVDRCIIRIQNDKKTIAYSVCETFTSGLNLFNLLNLMQIYIEDENYDLNEIIAAAVKEATYFYEKYKINDFNLFIRLKEGKFEEVKMDGIVYKQAAGRIVVDRTGTIEYKNLLLNMSR